MNPGIKSITLGHGPRRKTLGPLKQDDVSLPNTTICHSNAGRCVPLKHDIVSKQGFFARFTTVFLCLLLSFRAAMPHSSEHKMATVRFSASVHNHHHHHKQFAVIFHVFQKPPQVRTSGGFEKTKYN